MLSRTADHALRALLFLARQEGNSPVTVDRIAEALGAPRNYLGKTLNVLASRGLLEGVRGPAGGYRLRTAPDRIAVADLLECLDEANPMRGACLLGDHPCDGADPCGAHARWAAVMEAAWQPFRATTLSDLLDSTPG
jgi:Rrf2 family protein